VLVFREIKTNLLESSCLALGMFDGVHLGHQKVILSAVKSAQELNSTSTIVTFSRHPRHIKSRIQPRLITTLEEKMAIFEQIGVQAVVMLDFTEELSCITAEDYLENYLINGLNAKSISVGYNHHFGANKKGDGKFLKLYSSRYNYKLEIIPPVTIGGHVVSSSTIRKLIHSGEVDFAAKMLGRLYTIKNTVVKGMQRGKLLGFPTANLNQPAEKACPKAGVYSGIVIIDNKKYSSVINVGKRPTYADLAENLIEAHILNFNGDLYGKEIEIGFLKRIRDEVRFNSESELKGQIKEDCKSVPSCDLCFSI